MKIERYKLEDDLLRHFKIHYSIALFPVKKVYYQLLPKKQKSSRSSPTDLKAESPLPASDD